MQVLMAGIACSSNGARFGGMWLEGIEELGYIQSFKLDLACVCSFAE